MATAIDEIGGLAYWASMQTEEQAHAEALRLNTAFDAPAVYTVELMEGYPLEVQRRGIEFFIDGDYIGYTDDYSQDGIEQLVSDWADAMEE